MTPSEAKSATERPTFAVWADLDRLAKQAQATEAFAWIKEPFADRRRAARKPATREIEALRLGVLALIEELRSYDPAMRTAVSGVTGKATPLTADKERF